MSQYQRVPSNEVAAAQAEYEEERSQLSLQNPHTRATIDEFNRPPPAWWKRAALIGLIIFLGWFAVRLGRGSSKSEPKVIYATRYSDEFRYRPAASPVITEYLKDGRIRLRGATPGGVGVREEDVPLTPMQKAAIEKKKRDDAKEKALEQLKESKRKAKERARERRIKARAKKGARAGEP